MRKPIIAGNWKMNKTMAEARQLVSELVPGLEAIDGVDKILCPPFTALLAVAALLEGTDIGLGAQNMHWELSGAFTGEVSPSMIAEFCHYVIIGHSERRQYFYETDKIVNSKLQAALAHGLTPIVCVGETLDEYEAGRTDEIVTAQILQGFQGIDEISELEISNTFIVAYEPIWAIGTGRPSTASGAASVVQGIIRPALRTLFAEEFFAESEIDGALVGGASLKVADFIQIVQTAAT